MKKEELPSALPVSDKEMANLSIQYNDYYAFLEIELEKGGTVTTIRLKHEELGALLSGRCSVETAKVKVVKK